MEKQERESNLKHGIELVPPGKDLKLTIWTHELTE